MSDETLTEALREAEQQIARLADGVQGEYLHRLIRHAAGTDAAMAWHLGRQRPTHLLAVLLLPVRTRLEIASEILEAAAAFAALLKPDTPPL